MSNTNKRYQAALVPCSFTVSVTGHQCIGQNLALQKKTQQVLENIATVCKSFDANVDLRMNTALAAGADQLAARAVLSSNRSNKNHRWALQVILPFEQDSYRNSLTVGLEDTDPDIGSSFNDLLDQADSVYELADLHVIAPERSTDIEGARKQYWQSQRYRTLGKILARQADILLAIWDSKPAGGPGGTADVVALALTHGKSVIRIDSTTGLVSFLKPSHKDHIRLARQPTWDEQHDDTSLFADEGEFRALAKEVICQPSLIDEKEGLKDLLCSAEAFFGNADSHRLRLTKGKGLKIFATLAMRVRGNTYPESTACTTRWGQPYGLLVNITNLMCGKESPPKTLIAYKPADAITQQNSFSSTKGLRVNYAEDDWLQPPYCPQNSDDKETPDPSSYYQRDTPRPHQLNSADEKLSTPMIATDAIATARAHTYRSSYVTNFLFGAFAVWVGLAGLLLKPKFVYVGIELLILAALVLLYVLAARRCWHERWLNARFITETLRAGRYLVWLGMGGRRTLHHDAPWVAWYTNSVMASVPGPNGKLNQNDLRRIARELKCHVIHQINYHSSNANRLHKVHAGLEGISTFCLWAAIFIAFIFIYKSIELGKAHTDVIANGYFVSIMCAGLPVLAGAVTGIRFQGDFKLFAKRSEETKGQLEKINRRLSKLVTRDVEPSHQPLFEELSQIVDDINDTYERDLKDWYYVYSARPSTEPE